MVMSFSAAPIETQFGRLTTFTKADVTATGQGGAWTTANSPITLFTITGTVRIRITADVTTAVTSTANTGTLAVGIAGSTGLFFAAATVNGTNFPLNAVWELIATAPLATQVADTAAQDAGFTVSNTNVILTIATNNMTAGGMRIYAQWTPLSPGATVT